MYIIQVERVVGGGRPERAAPPRSGAGHRKCVPAVVFRASCCFTFVVDSAKYFKVSIHTPPDRRLSCFTTNAPL